MIVNMGNWDRYFRLIVGAFIASLVFWGPQNDWYLLGLIPFATGIFGWCPAYHLFGMTTCKKAVR